LGTSCQAKVIETQIVTKITPTVTDQNTKTKELKPTLTPISTPTLTQHRTAEDFEGCFTYEFDPVIYDPLYQYKYDDFNWVLNNYGIETIISKSKTANGITLFSINKTKIRVTEGTVLHLLFYTEQTGESLAAQPLYSLIYSPTSNEFVTVSNQLGPMPPWISILIFKDLLIDASLPPQDNYCLEQIKDAFQRHHISSEKECVINKIPNGDAYGWGINKNGDAVCPKVETEIVENIE